PGRGQGRVSERPGPWPSAGLPESASAIHLRPPPGRARTESRARDRPGPPVPPSRRGPDRLRRTCVSSWFVRIGGSKGDGSVCIPDSSLRATGSAGSIRPLASVEGAELLLSLKSGKAESDPAKDGL